MKINPYMQYRNKGSRIRLISSYRSVICSTAEIPDLVENLKIIFLKTKQQQLTTFRVRPFYACALVLCAQRNRIPIQAYVVLTFERRDLYIGPKTISPP
jgi:hypothetical protein